MLAAITKFYKYFNSCIMSNNDSYIKNIAKNLTKNRIIVYNIDKIFIENFINNVYNKK